MSLEASSVIIYNSFNQVLLSRRSQSKKIDPGLWETIGGKREPGETAEECIIREVSEELGSKVKLLNIKFFRRYEIQYKIGLITYDVFTSEISGEPEPNKNEIDCIKWSSQTEINDLKFCANVGERLRDFFKIGNALSNTN